MITVLNSTVGKKREGNSVYKITQIDKVNKLVYLQAFANTAVDAGWTQPSRLLEIKKLRKSKIARCDVEFV